MSALPYRLLVAFGIYTGESPDAIRANVETAVIEGAPLDVVLLNDFRCRSRFVRVGELSPLTRHNLERLLRSEKVQGFK